MTSGSAYANAKAPNVAVRHGRLAGRTRLRFAPPAKGQRALTLAVHNLTRDPRIRHVEVNPRVMSILIEHDPALSSYAIAELAQAAVSGRATIETAAPETGSQQKPAESHTPSIKALRRASSSTLKNADTLRDWHALNVASALKALNSRESGLGTHEALTRLAQFGPNALVAQKRRSSADILVEQFRSLPVWLLIGSAGLSVVSGGVFEAVVTVAVVAINAGIGFSTESWTERLIRRFTQTEDPDAPVWRDGEIKQIKAREVTLGDVLALSAGVAIPADARLIETDELAVDESVLTGESYPAPKDAEANIDSNAPLPARATMVHRGSMVSGGRGSAVVTAIGSDTEIGLVQNLLGSARPPQAPMDRELERLGVQLTIGCVLAGVAVMALLRLRGAPWLGVVRSGIALAVSAIPEGLPAIAATSKAVAAKALAERGVLVRNLSVIQTAGAVDVLCLDKTGTLTQNRMAATVVRTLRARHHVDPDTLEAQPALGPDSALLARVAILCNDAEVRLDGVSGSGTEAALLALAKTGGFDLAELRAEAPRIDAWYRNKDRAYMATEHAGAEGPRIAVKGAPEQVLALCETALVGGEARPLTPSLRKKILEQNEELAHEGLRVLGFAQSTNGTLKDSELGALHWLGLVGLSDPLRPGAAELIASFQGAGIRPLILTGDQAMTARALAEELALALDGVVEVVDATSLAAMSAKDIADTARRAHVFARVSPADKLRIVEALQADGHVVAMTGDGVNDGPALRAANIGLAMGQSGSKTAREIADIVIADDGLAGIATFLARGRVAESNIRRAVRFLIGTNLSETLLLILESLHGANELESPFELLWLNLVTDVFPALGLALSPPAEDVLTQMPRPADSPLFDRNEGAGIALDAASITLPSIISHFVAAARYGPGPQARGMTFLTLAGAQLVHTLTLAPKRAAHQDGAFLSRRGIETGVAVSGVLALAPYMFPPLGRLLGIAAPRGGDLLLSAALAATPLLRKSPALWAKLAAAPPQSGASPRT